MSRCFVLLLTVLLVLFAASCSQQEAPPAKPTTSAPAEAPNSPWNAVLETDPPRLRDGKPATFRVQLRDQEGKPVSGAQMHGSLIMPMMDMGKNEFPLADQGDGRYEGRGTPNMAGPWELIVKISKGDTMGEHRFELRVDE